MLIELKEIKISCFKTYNDTVFSNVDVRSDYSSIYNCIFSNENIVSYMKRKECNSSHNKKRLLTFFHIKLSLHNFCSVIYPLANFLKGGLITDRLLKIQYWPILTLAKSPRIILSPIIIFFPFRIMFCEPHSVD